MMMRDLEMADTPTTENVRAHSPTVAHDPQPQQQTIYQKYRRTILLVVAVTLHNIPEGIVVGFAFAAAGAGQITLSSAITLSIGVGIQNIPEGLAVSLPCQREGMSTVKSFLLGSVSGFIEPIGGLIGSALMLVSEKLLPYALAFAAGCMIFVVISELVPEITGANQHLGPDNPTATTHISHERTSRMGVLFFFVGFVLMMILDVTLS
jgi:zinc transporter ZupT